MHPHPRDPISLDPAALDTATLDTFPLDPVALVVALDHPSLRHLVPPFVDDLRREPRRFDRAGISNPKPFSSLIDKVTDSARRRFGIMVGRELVGMASLAADGEVAIAIVAGHRGQGLGGHLLQQIALIARRDGYGRLVMESSRRSRPIAELGRRLGWTAVELPHGRVELTLRLPCRLTG